MKFNTNQINREIDRASTELVAHLRAAKARKARAARASKVKFGRMEPMGAREDGGSMEAHVDGALVAEIVKEMTYTSWGSDCTVSCYEVTFFGPIDLASRSFSVAEVYDARAWGGGRVVKGDYPTARAALKAAKDYVREVCK